ncbi:MAG: ATP-binding protein [Pseudomonadota bacterium]
MTYLRKLLGSMFAQVTALVLGACTAALMTLVLFAQTPAVFELLPMGLADNADSIAELVWLVEQVPEDIEPYVLAVYEGGGRTATIRSDFDDARFVPSARLRRILNQGESDAISRLADRDIRFRRIGLRELRSARSDDGSAAPVAASMFQISIELNDGRVLEIRMRPATFFAERSFFLLIAIVCVVAVAAAVGLALAAIAFRPLQRLEREAEAIGGVDAPARLSESGPTEIRRVAAAINRMRSRLGELTREREHMASAVAHDIRTGITRIRLRSSAAETIDAASIESDLAQMERLTSDMLAYARAEEPSAPREIINLREFVADIAADCPMCKDPAQLLSTRQFQIVGDPVALRRLFHNLLENARRYAGGVASIRMERADGGLIVSVEDDGPGMPEDELENAFQPFQRGETSRSKDTGGTGLGLGIARSIARAHGANLTLRNRPGGGLSACVVFPSNLET